ncbi:MAG: adenosylcobinamide-phosphate synthase CbiB [Pseudomonadota bacterium]
MSTGLILAAAMALDGVFGEPKWLWDRLPHPAVLMGRAVGYLDQRLNTGDGRCGKGVLAMVLLVLGAAVLGLLLQQLGWVVEVIIAAILLAQKSLVQHVRAVADALRVSVHDGRLSVAMIVGRNTSAMDGPAVSRAAIESAAENFSDGVIAPAFWFLVAGLPGMLIYKITNTADSMVGYRTPRHEEFGWAAARLDDVLNVLPARITALGIAALYGRLGQLGEIAKAARLHRSPNAGWPEAAVAEVLGVALSGPRSYEGEMRDFPFVNPDGARDIGPDQIDASIGLLWRVWGAGLAVVGLVGILLAQ